MSTGGAAGESGLPDLRQVLVVARKEYMDNVRGRWLLALSLLFIMLCLAVSAFGGIAGGGDIALRSFEVTVVGLMSLVATLVPIIALMSGYAAIAGEREQGSLQLLLTMPVTRTEVLLGKFVGLGAVIATSTVAGLGLAGLLIAATAGLAGWQGFLAFIGGTVMLGLSFLSISLLFSSLVSKRSSALGLAVFVWFFFSVIWGLIFLAIMAAAGVQMDFSGGFFDIPEWMWAVDVVNPNEATQALTLSAFGINSFLGFSVEYPPWISAGSMILVLVVWTAVPMLLALYRLDCIDL
jgi:ABC-type transport system involved in multi-copper enzyme maturation permease subunit